MLNNMNIDKFCETDFTLGEVQFRITKLNVMDGYRMLERIRKQLATTADKVEIDRTSDVNSGLSIIQSIMQLDEAFVEEMRKKLFTSVEFKGNGAMDYIKLEGSEDMAFQSLQPTHIYEVLVRSLVVNFMDSVKGLMSALPKAN